MKRIVLIAAAVLSTQFGQAQFEKFEDLNEVTTVVVNEGMFQLLAGIEVDLNDPEAQEFKEIVNKLKGIKVLTTANAKIGAEMRDAAMSYQKQQRLEELMSVKDQEANIKFYTRNGKKNGHVSELLMVIYDINGMKAADREVETVVVSIIGDIDLNKIGSLTGQMNLPKELNKVNKR